MMQEKNIWVIIAAYNESKNIVQVIEKTKKFCKNIIVVDDGSKDITYQKAKKAGVIVLRHIINMGKGVAVRNGCDYALKKGAEILILIDGDGQHEPKEIPHFLKALDEKDIVFSYRKASRTQPFILKFGNKFITKTIKLLYNISLKDTQSGFRALTKDAYKKVRWSSYDYAMESEMIANAGKNHLEYTEIPIETIYHDRYKGTTVIDGIKIVLNMLSWRLKG